MAVLADHLALAFLITVKVEDKVRGLGVSILLWLIFSMMYDGLVLLLASAFVDYPLEKPMLALIGKGEFEGR